MGEWALAQGKVVPEKGNAIARSNNLGGISNHVSNEKAPSRVALLSA